MLHKGKVSDGQTTGDQLLQMSQSRQGSLARIHLKLQEGCHGTSPQLLWDQGHCLHCGEKAYFTLHATTIKTHLEQHLTMLL